MAGLPEGTRRTLDKTPTSLIVEYLTERLGPVLSEQALSGAVAGESLPTDTRTLCELLAERLDLAVGQCRLECNFEDGRLRGLWKHAHVGALALERSTGAEP